MSENARTGGKNLGAVDVVLEITVLRLFMHQLQSVLSSSSCSRAVGPQNSRLTWVCLELGEAADGS